MQGIWRASPWRKTMLSGTLPFRLVIRDLAIFNKLSDWSIKTTGRSEYSMQVFAVKAKDPHPASNTNSLFDEMIYDLRIYIQNFEIVTIFYHSIYRIAIDQQIVLWWSSFIRLRRNTPQLVAVKRRSRQTGSKLSGDPNLRGCRDDQPSLQASDFALQATTGQDNLTYWSAN